MNIAGVLAEQAVCRAGQLALADGARSLTFAQLNEAAARAAADLRAAGLRPGDRAIVVSPMSVGLYVTLVGMFRAGIVAVFVDPSAGRRQIAACCETLQPRGFVASPVAHVLRILVGRIRRIPVHAAIGRRVPCSRTVAAAVAHGPCADAALAACDDSTPALITFTSGSTGEPKVIVRTHGFLMAQHRVIADDLQLRAGDVDLSTLPVFVLANLASGVTSIIPDVDLRSPGAIDPARLLRQLAANRPHRIAASPALLERLIDHLENTGGRLGVRRIYTGGGPVFPVLLDRLSTVAPGAAVTAVYGSSEAEPIATLDHRDIGVTDRERMRNGAGLLAGRPVGTIEVRVILEPPPGSVDGEAFEALACATGQPGEIVVSGTHVLAGYLDGRGDAGTKIRVGRRVWHRTGDAGYLDDDGRVWLLGRCSARITDRRGTVYPFAVECAASSVAGIRRTALASHDGRRVLVAECAAPAPAGIAEDLRRRLHWAQIDEVCVVRRIPVDRRHNAKIDYDALTTLIGRRLRRPPASVEHDAFGHRTLGDRPD